LENKIFTGGRCSFTYEGGWGERLLGEDARCIHCTVSSKLSIGALKGLIKIAKIVVCGVCTFLEFIKIAPKRVIISFGIIKNSLARWSAYGPPLVFMRWGLIRDEGSNRQ
jgi:hypothetical protein